MELKKLIESEINPQNVRAWNMAQIRAWKAFVKKHNLEAQKVKDNYSKFVKKHNANRVNKIDVNDLQLLMKYALWFREFFMNKGKIPTYRETPSLRFVNNYKATRIDSGARV